MLKAVVLAVVLTADPASAFAQSQTAAPITKLNTRKATLTVTAIDQKTRSVTLRGEQGDEGDRARTRRSETAQSLPPATYTARDF